MLRTRQGLFVLLLILLVLSACSKEVDVTAVRLSESSMTLTVGETATLKASVEPATADYDMVTWSSSDPSVATVKDGVIQVHKTGTASIIASAGGVASRVCTVTVEEPAVEPSAEIQAEETEVIPEVSEEVSEEMAEEVIAEAIEDEIQDVVEGKEGEETGEVLEVGETEDEEDDDAGDANADDLGDCFRYYVDFGEDGSYIDIDSLVTVTDWRGRDFNDYPNYWGYYGPFVITMDIENAECDLNGTRQSLPESIILFQSEPGKTIIKDPTSGLEVKFPENRHGFLMCRFSTIGLTQNFNIFIKAKVQYGFGTIETDWITIPVVMESSI